MQTLELSFTDHTDLKIAYYKWIPEKSIPLKGLIQIVHGMGEHAKRYEFYAEELTKKGFVVYAEDHRGHGKTMLSPEKSGVLDPDGWDGVVKDLKQLKDIMIKDYPDLPVYIFGHSWGSFLTQDYMEKWGSELKGVILSGSTGKQDMIRLLLLIGKREVKKHGANTPAGLIYKLGIEPLNKKFEPAKSPNAWISSVESEVEKYDADPLCGFRPPNSYFVEMATAMKRIWKPQNEFLIPKDLPIYIIVGELDPVGNFTKNTFKLINRYAKQEKTDVSYKVYANARHEVLNEHCRDEVIKDTIEWLNAHN